MPTYDYSCNSCGSFDTIRAISMRDQPAPCPECGQLSDRVLVFGSNLSCVDAQTRQAMEGNERASHLPISSRDYDSNKYSRLRHPNGCGCCVSGIKKSATRTFENGNKTFLGKRPWMISH